MRDKPHEARLAPSPKQEHMWKKPARGIVKINMDASFCSENMPGAIARDANDDFITAAASWFIPHVCSADSVEISAVCNGILLALRIGCNWLVIESDISNAVEICNQDEDYFGPDAAIDMDWKQMTADSGKN